MLIIATASPESESPLFLPAFFWARLGSTAIPSPPPLRVLFDLHFRRTRVIHVVTAEITAKGENMTSITEAPSAAPATAAPAKATKKTSPAKRARKKARAVKKTPKGAKKARSVRGGSKTAKVLDLLKRAGGATAKELIKVTGWQPHSVRGFLSGTVGKKMGLTVTSTKGEDGERRYSVKA
jgi:hypothetical protein